MKKNFCILLALCLTLCTVFYMPAMAADKKEGKEEKAVQPRNGVTNYVYDNEGYQYKLYGATVIMNNLAQVSTDFVLTDHQMTTAAHKAEIAKRPKWISAHANIQTANSASESFGDHNTYTGVSQSIMAYRTYLYNVVYMYGTHSFKCDQLNSAYTFHSVAN